MDSLQKQYNDLLDSLHFQEDELDYNLLSQHIATFSSSDVFTGSAISIFDMHQRKHVYESTFHKVLFQDQQGEYSELHIHPDDFTQVMKNGVASMRHVFLHKKSSNHLKHYKLIREYRVLIHNHYKRIIEEMQPLEIDSRGNVWLILCIVNISPNQQAPYKVTAQLIDFCTGDTFSPVDDYFDKNDILSHREIEILTWIEQGKLSKEIAEKLHISIHTVNTHRQRILQKLKVDNSIEAVRYARILGILND